MCAWVQVLPAVGGLEVGWDPPLDLGNPGGDAHLASLTRPIKLDGIEDIVCRLVAFLRNLERLSLVTDVPDVPEPC